MGRKKQRVTIGHEYSLGMHMVVGHANMDAVEKMRVGEKVAWIPAVPHPDNITNGFITGDDNSAFTSSIRFNAQTFTVSGNGYYTVSIKLLLYRDAGYSSNTTISINSVDASGMPTDAIISAHGGNAATSNAVVASSITTDTAGTWVEFIFPTQVYLAASAVYAIVLKPEGANVYWRYDSANGYAGGSLYLRNSGVWGISSGNDALFDIYLAEGNSPNHTIFIVVPDLFGGQKKEGGIRGNVDLLFGASDQTRNPYLVTNLDANIPAFRGSMGFVLNQVYVGTSPYIKPWAFFCRRLLTQVSGDVQWNITKAIISAGEESGDDLNPAHIIRECLIDNDWGMGFVESDIDSTSFELAADILYDEVFGLSLLWDQTEPIEDFVGSILRTIAGFLYQDLASGKWVLSLTRDPATLNFSLMNKDIYNSGDDSFLSQDVDNWSSQVFTATFNYSLGSIKLLLYRLGATSPGTVTVSIRAVTGSPQTATPTGTDLAEGVIDGSTLTTDTAGEWTEIILTEPLALTLGTKYAIVLRCAATGGSLALKWRSDGSAATYTNGNSAVSAASGGDGTWSPSITRDNMFELYEITIESFDENHIMAVEEFARPSYGEVTNQVTVNWWDKIENKSRPVVAQDIALIEKQGNNIIESNLNHYGICNATLANKVAERELKLASSMLAAMRLKCTRRMSHLKPNGVFKLSWSDLGIVQMIVRVINVDYGSLQANEVFMTCLEDAFSTAETVYQDPPDSEWTDPINDALDISNIDIIEIPYWILVNDIENQSVVDSYADASGYLLLAVAPPTSDSLDFEILMQQATGLPFNSEGIAAFAFNATLTTGMFEEAQNVTVDIENVSGLTSVSDNSYAVIGNEMVKVVSVDTDNNQITVERGVFDTVPESHSLGDFVYFIGDGYINIENEYTDGDQPAFKILPRTGTGQLLEASASTQTADLLDSRFIRPYPPGNLLFNTESFPTFLSTAITGGFEITWAHRDRTHATQVGTIVLHTDATNYGPEAGTTYTVKVYDEDDVLARTASGIAGTAYEYTEAFEISDNGALQKQLRFEIYAVRDGFDSWQLGYNVLIKRTLVSAVNAVSSTTSSLSNLVALVGSVSAASSASSPGINEVLFVGSSDAVSSVAGILAGFIGSVSASSGATGSLTV